VELAAAVREALPAELSAAVRSASIAEDGTLVVTTSSSLWANRLRFEADKMLAACRRLHPDAGRARIRVGVPAEGN
jgi:hypothetical protein